MNNFEALEERIVQLLNKLKENHLLIHQLTDESHQLKQKAAALDTQVQILKKDNEALKMANSLLGSNESKATTKRKINSLIKEVDFCIHQLTAIK